jgi:murein DD-endopeptidase MepM/ murein hydrolase activator NlpD
VQFDPSPARQGDTVLINLSANRRFRVTGSLGGRPLQFVLRGDGGVAEAAWAVAGVAATESPGELALQLTVVDDLGRESPVTVGLSVVAAQFGSEVINVPADKQGLLDSAVSVEEASLVHELYRGFTPTRLWDGRFQWPHVGEVTSAFAMSRVYNDGRRNGYHGGVDISGDVGMPVYAAAAGQVVLAAELQVRGGTIILDHGLGVFSAYYHLATIGVKAGQRVNRGDIIAQIGNTGLSTGAHLHWEMAVGGVLVDPREWAARDIPGNSMTH